jgi:succinyl-CoA synthetase beta subunit
VREVGLTSAAGRASRRHERREGQEIIRKESGLNVIAADNLRDAAQKVVKAVKG